MTWASRTAPRSWSCSTSKARGWRTPHTRHTAARSGAQDHGRGRVGARQAHRAGIVHRDLKPGNVMLTKTWREAAGFRSRETHRRRTGVQARHQLSAPRSPDGVPSSARYRTGRRSSSKAEADVRSDIFAFGAVVNEMVMGRKAFEGASQASVIATIVPTCFRAIDSLDVSRTAL